MTGQPLDGISVLLTDQAFENLMADLGPFEARPHIAIAVSGGADSLCLALLAGRWAKRHGGRATALTVDHGLRDQSAEEARQVGGWLKPEGIGHHILGWQGPKPKTGVQAAARAARYALMQAWCRAHGVLHLALAHTQDDQAETFLLRLGAGSGADGLAAMTAIRETADVRLLRPLLDVPKAALQATLQAQDQEWIEDPSNRDTAFARVRVRQSIGGGGLDARGLARSAYRFGRARQALEGAASQLLARSAQAHPAGFAVLQCAPLEAAADEISLRALGRVVAAIGGRDYGPRLDRLERLHRGLLTNQSASAATLGGCRLMVDGGVGGRKLLVCRETRGLPAPLRVNPGERLMWDRRFEIRLGGEGGGGARLMNLGERGWAEIVDNRPDLRQRSIPGPVRVSLPALFDDFGVYSVPHLGFRRENDTGSGASQGPNFEEIRFSPPNSFSSTGFFLRNEPDILSL
ncbi:MAG: tRNA lysidine(34) synthetase TilS [Proteobacteria bacterium]|nr:tRNA lysidine(34) synthetase TilS [Pseudomonadota bacterium]